MAKKTPAINSSSTADIAFLLLCYFLMTTTMGTQTGLSRRLPPMPDPNQKVEDQKVNRRNIIIVKINSADRLLAGNEPMDISLLKDKVKEFLSNPKNMENPKAEFFIPLMVNKLINEGTSTVRVLDTTSKWFGVTYAADREDTVKRIGQLVADGVYPNKLF